MFIDAHCHLAQSAAFAKLQQDLPVASLINCESAAEFAMNQRFTAGTTTQFLSLGLHPWHAADRSLAELLPLFEQASVIGEIGLDTVWTETPLSLQRPVFTEQLAWAQRLQKPVLLHTKGAEAEILATIRDYPNRYLVHWYSELAWQQDYIDCGCYFTIGPDVRTNPAVQALAKKVPLTRLLIESDGLAALSWAQEREISLSDYLPALEDTLHYLCEVLGLPLSALETQLEANFHRFLGHDYLPL